uniref:Uncharacterized protein n=1 Tax=Anopheles stephensi TaxID=30069 RepID=A0A182YMI3_ANOST
MIFRRSVHDRMAGGISLGAGVSTAGISGMASTSHTGPNHNVAGTIGGSVGTSTGVQASGAANASATILGATIDHTHTSNVTLTEDGFHASHAGQNTIDSQQVTVAGTVGVSVGVGAGLIDTSLNHTGHVSVGGIDVSSATAVGAGIEANHTSIGLGAQLTHNASISIPTVTPGRPTTEPPPEELQPTSSTPIPGSPGTAIGVYPPTKPIDTSSPPGSSPSSSSSSPSSPSAPPPSSSSGGGDNYAPPPNYQIAVSQYPYFFVPYPYPPPNVPQAPCNCPADQQNQQQGGQQPAGYLGFIPVLYIPNCHAQKSGLPANFNWPAPPPPEGFGQSLDELPAQRLFQKPDGSWVLQRARNRSRRLRGRRPAARRFLTGEPEIPGKK